VIVCLGEELFELAALAGVIWLICLAFDYQSTMQWTNHFLHAAHDFLDQTLATLGWRS
jgi:hypothetical protein